MHRIFIIITLILTSFQADARVLDTVGATYPIAEKDALLEIEEAARKVDWGSVFDRKVWERRVREFRPGDAAILPHAKEDRSRIVDMTYALEFDIPDEKGNIIYPRGYVFNPLEFMNAPLPTLIIIDGSSREQMDWYRASPYFKQPDAMLLITGGSWYELSRELKHPVFYLPEQVKDRLKLEVVPSVVSRNGKSMEVKEYGIGKKGK